MLLVWLTAWDALEDASEFAVALSEFLPQARVERRDARVLVILGPAGDQAPDLDGLARSVWAASTLTRADSAPPPRPLPRRHPG